MSDPAPPRPAAPGGEITSYAHLDPRQRLVTLGGLMLTLLLAAMDQTIVGTAMPRVVASLDGFDRYPVGDHRLPAHLDDLGPGLRQAVGPVRTQVALPGRPGDLRRVVVAVRRLGQRPAAARRHESAHLLPRPPGHRRRRRDGPHLHDHRRPLLAGRTRPLPGHVRRGVRPGLDRRAARRRVHHRPPVVALGVLRQRAARHRRPHRALPHVSVRRPARQHQGDRLARPGDARRAGSCRCCWP